MSLSGFFRRVTLFLQSRKFIFWLVVSACLAAVLRVGVCTLSGGIFYSQALLSIPSVVTILNSLSFLGSVRRICFLLSCGLLYALQLHCGGLFCGWHPWKHISRRWQSHRIPCVRCPRSCVRYSTCLSSVGDLRQGLLCSVSSIITLPSAFCHAEVCWNLLAFDAPFSFTVMGLSPFFFFFIPLASF